MHTMKTWVRRSLNAGALTAGALLVTGTAAHASPTMVSTDNVGVLNGSQALVPVQAPVNVCGNAAGVAGSGAASCEGGATALDPEWSSGHYAAGHRRRPDHGPTMVSTDNVGIGNGTQLLAPIQVPVNVCGNAVAVLGHARAGCEGGAEAGPPPQKPYQPKPKPRYDDDKKQYESTPAAATAPAEVVAVSSGDDPTLTSTGHVGVLNGTQALIPVQLPINICGNAIGVLGVAQAGCEGGASATNH